MFCFLTWLLVTLWVPFVKIHWAVYFDMSYNLICVKHFFKKVYNLKVTPLRIIEQAIVQQPKGISHSYKREWERSLWTGMDWFQDKSFRCKKQNTKRYLSSCKKNRKRKYISVCLFVDEGERGGGEGTEKEKKGRGMEEKEREWGEEE